MHTLIWSAYAFSNVSEEEEPDAEEEEEATEAEEEAEAAEVEAVEEEAVEVRFLPDVDWLRFVPLRSSLNTCLCLLMRDIIDGFPGLEEHSHRLITSSSYAYEGKKHTIPAGITAHRFASTFPSSSIV